MECWGCTDIPEFHDGRFHSWRACPHREDPKVRENANQRYKQRMEAKRPGNSRINITEAIADYGTQLEMGGWEDAGFPSKEISATIMSMANPGTSKSVRKQLYTALKSKLTGRAATPQVERTAQVPVAAALAGKIPRKDREGGKGKEDYFIVSALPKVNQVQLANMHKAFARKLDYGIQISQLLPHINFPLGPKNMQGTKITLKAMIDTGAGLSLGRFQYHKAIQEKYPELVHQFEMLDDLEGCDPFSIGGVGEGGTEPMVIAIITYKTPFVVNGQPMLFTMALSKETSVNTIFGLPFLKSLKAAVLLESDLCLLGRLGKTYLVDYSVPRRDDVIPTVSLDAVGTFHSPVIDVERVPIRGLYPEAKVNIPAIGYKELTSGNLEVLKHLQDVISDTGTPIEQNWMFADQMEPVKGTGEWLHAAAESECDVLTVWPEYSGVAFVKQLDIDEST